LLTSFSSSSSSSRIGKRRRRKAIKCPFENVSLLSSFSSSLLLLKRQASSGRKIQQLSRELYYTRL
jgi:hypothetical protein